MSRLATNVSFAARSIREQRGRAWLSAVGIMVATIAIVVLISIARGVQEDVSREVGDLGVNLLIVLPARIEEDSLFNPGMLGISKLTEGLIPPILGVPGVVRATPLTFVGAGASVNGAKSHGTLILAVRPEWFRIRPVRMAEGRTFAEPDAEKPVCVLGSVAKQRLVGPGPGIGRVVDYDGRRYTVVGVTAQTGSGSSLFSQGSFENVVYIPYGFLKSIQPGAQIDRIFIQTEPNREPKSLVASVEGVLAKRLNRETYSVLTQQDLLKLVFKLMGILEWLLIGLTSIALFVGGVGIMTVMLMSVGERTKEIGIRKTVGARKSDVFLQFLSEAVILVFSGGLLGLAASYAACLALYYLTPIKPLVTWQTVGISMGVSLAVGAVFGLVPAMRAAAREPVASLRYE